MTPVLSRHTEPPQAQCTIRFDSFFLDSIGLQTCFCYFSKVNASPQLELCHPELCRRLCRSPGGRWQGRHQWQGQVPPGGQSVWCSVRPSSPSTSCHVESSCEKKGVQAWIRTLETQCPGLAGPSVPGTPASVWGRLGLQRAARSTLLEAPRCQTI